MGNFEVQNCKDIETIKSLFMEYSQIKGAEGCFVSFDKELADLEAFYSGGALTTKPSVMQIGYGLYKRMGFEEVSEKEGTVSMRMELGYDRF